MNSTGRTKVFLILFFLLSGGSLAGLGLYWGIMGQNARSWDQVRGTLHSVEETSSIVKGRSVSGIRVKYSYNYRAQAYEGTRVCFGGSGKDKLDRVRYFTKDRVLVWVDPKDPTRSVLVPGIMSGAVAFLVFGGFVLIVALCIAWSIVKAPLKAMEARAGTIN